MKSPKPYHLLQPKCKVWFADLPPLTETWSHRDISTPAPYSKTLMKPLPLLHEHSSPLETGQERRQAISMGQTEDAQLHLWEGHRNPCKMGIIWFAHRGPTLFSALPPIQISLHCKPVCWNQGIYQVNSSFSEVITLSEAECNGWASIRLFQACLSQAESMALPSILLARLALICQWGGSIHRAFFLAKQKLFIIWLPMALNSEKSSGKASKEWSDFQTSACCSSSPMPGTEDGPSSRREEGNGWAHPHRLAWRCLKCRWDCYQTWWGIRNGWEPGEFENHWI